MAARRPRLLAVALLPSLALASVAPTPFSPRDGPAPAVSVVGPGLHQEGVQVLADGRRVAVPAGRASIDEAGTRVPSPAAAVLAEALGAPLFAPPITAGDAADEARAQRAWLTAGTVPGVGGPYEGLARTALLDLDALLLSDGAAVAGWSSDWRYVWPRDAAFVAVALARTGHGDDALAVLGFLQRVQRPDGSFEARYLPDGSGPPDDRAPQSDGTGWALWATGLVAAQLAEADRPPATEALRSLVVRSAERATALVAGGLPAPSPDYWEVPEQTVTLGTAAPLVAGLQQAGALLRLLDEPWAALAAEASAARAAEAVVDAFGPSGYGRYPGVAQADAAAAFVLPPFWRAAPDGAVAAWQASAVAMARPAGGLSPGAGWKDDGITWTPQTALYAWVAAQAGDDEAARRWLDVLATHRTARGSLSEKLLADGSPAAVAPLGWTAALVVLTVDALG